MMTTLKGRVFEAQRFVLKDKDGNIRAEWGVEDNNAAVLALMDKNGARRAELSVEADGPAALALKDQDGRPFASLALKGGQPSLLLYDRQGKVRAVLNVDEAPSLEFRSPTGALLKRFP